MSTLRHLYILLLLLSTAQMAMGQARKQQSAQQRKSAITAQTQSTQLANAYLDSLKMYRAKIDSLTKENEQLRESNGYAADNKYYRFFAPLAYYPDVVGKQLSMNGKGLSQEDNALMQIYLSKPELLTVSANSLRNMQAESIEGEGDIAPERMELTKEVVQTEPTEQPSQASIGNENLSLYVAKPKFWKFAGDYYLQFMQNYVSENWYKSGSNNYSMLGAATLQYDYNNKQKVKWENKLEMKLGFITSESDTVNKFKSSEDLLRYTSKLGIQAFKDWYYTVQAIAATQFTRGLKDNNKKIYSDFLSPFNLNLSVGMDYNVNVKEKLKGSIHLAPLAYNLKYCDRLNLAKSFGIDEDHHAKHEFGSQVTIELAWAPWDFFRWQSRFYAFTSYHNVVAEWENTFSFKFNKYISANVFLYPRFDDSVTPKDGQSLFQFKEYFSLGFSYSM